MCALACCTGTEIWQVVYSKTTFWQTNLKRTLQITMGRMKTRRTDSSDFPTQRECSHCRISIYGHTNEIVKFVLVRHACKIFFSSVYSPLAHLPERTLFAPPNFAKALFSISLGTAVIPGRNEQQRLCKILGGQIRCISGDVQKANVLFSAC